MNTQVKPRPAPSPTKLTQEFWDAAKEGKLLMQYDPTAKKYQFWPRTISVRTGKQNLQWKEVSGKGKIYSVTETYVPTPGFEGKTPYLVGLVELDEGVRVIANLINVKYADAKIGTRVKVTWEKVGDDMQYFAFEPA